MNSANEKLESKMITGFFPRSNFSRLYAKHSSTLFNTCTDYEMCAVLFGFHNHIFTFRKNNCLFFFLLTCTSKHIEHRTEEHIHFMHISFMALSIANCQLTSYTQPMCQPLNELHIFCSVVPPFEDCDGDRFLCTFIAHIFELGAEICVGIDLTRFLWLQRAQIHMDNTERKTSNYMEGKKKNASKKRKRRQKINKKKK